MYKDVICMIIMEMSGEEIELLGTRFEIKLVLIGILFFVSYVVNCNLQDNH